MFNGFLLRLSLKKPHLLILIALSHILGAISVLAWCYYLAFIIDGVFLRAVALSELKNAFIGLAAALLVRLASSLLSEEAALRLSGEVRTKLTAQILAKMNRIGPLALKKYEKDGSLLNLLTEGIELLDGWFRSFLPLFLKAVIFPLLFLIYVFPKDALSGIVLLITAPLVVVFMLLIGRFSAISSKRSWKVLEQINAYLQDVIYGLPTLKMLGQSEKQTDKIAQISDKFRRTNLTVLKVAFLSAFTLELVTTISIAMVAVGLGIRLIAAEVDFLTALMIIFLAPEYYMPLRNLGGQFHTNLNAGEAAQSIADFLASEENLLFAAENSVSTKDIAANDDGLIFEQVSYFYADHVGVENISFAVPQQKITVLIGPSGGGKTTILNLAAGLLRPAQGTISYQGQILGSTNADFWRKNIAYIPQRPHIMAMSLLDNLRLGVPSATQTEVEKIVELLELEDFIASFPQGYAALLGEGGRELSGGQKQLVAIIRAALKPAELILCDEFSQGLDLLSEEKILTALQKLAQEKTLLLAAHRKNCVESADYAVKIADGRISYQGSVADLRQNNADFQQYIRRNAYE